jgi:hypothetical protein
MPGPEGLYVIRYLGNPGCGGFVQSPRRIKASVLLPGLCVVCYLGTPGAWRFQTKPGLDGAATRETPPSIELTLTIPVISPVLRVMTQVRGRLGRWSIETWSRRGPWDARPRLGDGRPRPIEDPPGMDARRAAMSTVLAEGAASDACAGNGAKSWRSSCCSSRAWGGMPHRRW